MSHAPSYDDREYQHAMEAGRRIMRENRAVLAQLPDTPVAKPEPKFIHERAVGDQEGHVMSKHDHLHDMSRDYASPYHSKLMMLGDDPVANAVMKGRCDAWLALAKAVADRNRAARDFATLNRRIVSLEADIGALDAVLPPVTAPASSVMVKVGDLGHEPGNRRSRTCLIAMQSADQN